MIDIDKPFTQDILSATKSWFDQALTNPTDQNRTTQLGVHFEEVVEMIAELTPVDPETNEAIFNAIVALKHFSDHLKRNPGCVTIEPENRQNFIDSIADQLVTAVGSAHVFNMDPVGALNEVNRSNYSKFVNGEPIFDENMKVQKGPNYFKADLEKFI